MESITNEADYREMFKTLLRFTAFKSGGGCARDLLPSFGSSQKKELGSLLKEHRIRSLLVFAWILNRVQDGNNIGYNH